MRDVIRLRDLVAGETNHYDDAMYIVRVRRIGLDMRSRAVINYYVARTELSRRSSILTAIVSFRIYILSFDGNVEELQTPVADSRQQATVYTRKE